MLEHVSEGFVTTYCALVGTTVKVYSSMSTYGGNFIVFCNGCDFSHNCAACTECRVSSERYWSNLHQLHPDLSASRLTTLPHEEFP